MDGLAICRQVRETSSVPIMIISMKNKIVERVNALGAGADDFMCKPFSMHELIARAHALIRRQNVSIVLSLVTVECEGLTTKSAVGGRIYDNTYRTTSVYEIVETTIPNSKLLHQPGRCTAEKIYCKLFVVLILL